MKTWHIIVALIGAVAIGLIVTDDSSTDKPSSDSTPITTETSRSDVFSGLPATMNEIGRIQEALARELDEYAARCDYVMTITTSHSPTVPISNGRSFTLTVQYFYLYPNNETMSRLTLKAKDSENEFIAWSRGQQWTKVYLSNGFHSLWQATDGASVNVHFRDRYFHVLSPDDGILRLPDAAEQDAIDEILQTAAAHVNKFTEDDFSFRKYKPADDGACLQHYN